MFRLSTSIALALILQVFSLTSTNAATFTVDSTVDEVDANPGDGICATAEGACTLRAAVQETNVLGGPNTIRISSGIYTLTIPGAGEDGSASGDLDLNALSAPCQNPNGCTASAPALTLQGDGAASTIIDGNRLDRVLDVHTSLSAFEGVTMRDVAIRNGAQGVAYAGGLTMLRTIVADNLGEGIVQNNTYSGSYGNHLTLDDSVVERNGARGVTAGSFGAWITNCLIQDNLGGGLSVYGDPGAHIIATAVLRNHAYECAGVRLGAWVGSELSNSYIADNIAIGGPGGGVCITQNSRISDTTVANNTAAGDAGGILLESDSFGITIENSTISSNSSKRSGGGIYNASGYGPLNLKNATLVANVADSDGNGSGDGGALFTDPPAEFHGSLSNVQSTLFSRNLDRGGEAPLCGGVLTTLGTNLFDSTQGCTMDVQGPGDLLDVDAQLGPLADNGGPAPTHALHANSPGIDSAGQCGLTTDERGVGRPQGAACDIGAYEFACGNGTLDLGESCDDGNTLNGDCCSANCQIEPNGSPCTDGDACTTEACDGTGTCAPGPPVDCGACQTCDNEAGCVASVLTGCHQPTERFSSQLLLLNTAKPKLTWQWTKGEATDLADFGDPFVGDRYSLCLFDESRPTPQLAFRATTRAGLCNGTPCWRTAGASSFKYKDREQTPDGLDSLLLKSGPDGKAKVLVSGRGSELALPTLPLHLPARIQLQAENGQCWEAQYFALGVSLNDGAQFKGKAFRP